MFGRIVSCSVPSQPSRRAAVRVRNPFSCFQNLCWPDVASLWTVLFRELHECAYGLDILEGFTSSGYLDVTAAASLGGPFRFDVFCTHSICSSVQRLLRWARELFRSSSLAKFMIVWVSRRYRQPGELAPFRKSHVSSPTSAVNASSLAHICGDVALTCVDSVAQRMLL